jgi:thiol:disulfide interchange protein DsbD
MGTSLTAMAASSSSSTSGLTGSFFSGVLATVVATPCTGPFLGTAIGFAVTLPALQSLLIFTSLGLGMSLPYLLLAAFPALLRFLPKPGNWMVTFKEIMGFLMVGTAIWLVWVFSAQTNHLAVVLLLCGFFVLGIGCWILGKWGTPICSRLVRRIAFAIAILNFGVGGFIIYNSTLPWVMVYGGETASSSKASGWEVYSEERVADLQKQGIPVFVDFTAKWCLICQANHYILTTDSVSKKFDELGVVKMKADWTKKDDSITRALRKFGRNGVPLYVLYGSDPSTQPVILPQVLTSEIVIDHLEKVKGREANIAKD